ncbi:unnamed protein product [Dibothriocephalus latus]|uniref:Uncharacterized protein n=1 Tax=Dibothriocephalus latus TaxID=60516 RepID=A0A3P7LYA1_DIBLA|nr:unnamed protein product [Dibothriocephalus latus]
MRVLQVEPLRNGIFETPDYTPSCGCAKGTLAITFKALAKPHLTYAAPIWSPIISSSSLHRLQSAQNPVLRTITGFYKMSPIDHLHAASSFGGRVRNPAILIAIVVTLLNAAAASIRALHKEAVASFLSDLPADGSATKTGFQRLY